MLQGVTERAQKCQAVSAPNFYRVTEAPRTAPSALHPKGASSSSQRCQTWNAPTNFIWCCDHLAEMPLLKRTKGRAAPWPQQCHMRLALPTQFNGVIVKTQKCRDIVAPRERPEYRRRNAIIVAPRPTNHRSHHDIAEMLQVKRSTGEANAQTQQCRNKSASPNQSQGVTLFAQKCHRKPAPTEFGPLSSRGNAIGSSPNNQRPVQTRRNANPPSPRNIKRKTNGQEI